MTAPLTGARGSVARQELDLARRREQVEARIARLCDQGFGRRLWQKDTTLWSSEPVPELDDRLGWLDLPETAWAELPALERFGAELAAEGTREVVVLGMGGSSLAPEVFQRTFGNRPGYPPLSVLDSTHPAAVAALARRLELARTLFVVSSKSGTTTETLSFFRFFWERTARELGEGEAGRRFVAVTDPGTPLAELARQRGFREVFAAPEEVGGRYSALTAFGLVPAAAIGVDLRALLESARAMALACGPEVPDVENPAVVLGAALGELARAGRDKVTFVTSPALAAVPDWLEQLVAESTGKSGRGIVPVVGEPPGPAAVYGRDRFFVALLAAGDAALEPGLAEVAAARHPVARLTFSDPLAVGGEIFRWEMAVAVAGAILGIQPFDQPDVQLAKELAQRAMREGAGRGAGSGAGGVEVADRPALKRAIDEWLGGARDGYYLCVQAFLAPTPQTTAALGRLQALLRDRTRLASTWGYGPRFLHSTGQLHKGGPNTGLFLQLVDDPGEDLPVPETDHGFAALIAAQAEGDRRALEQRGRRVQRVRLGRDAGGGLARLLETVEAARAR